MSNITTTIAKLQKNFEAWHEDRYDILHKKTTNYIDTQIETFKSESSDTTGAILAQITTIGQFLAQSIDGNDGHITNIDSISNVLHNKNHNFNTINLQQLDAQIKQKTTNITTKLENDYATKAYAESLINSYGIKTIEIPSNKNLNNYTNFGFYKSTDAAITNTITNRPINSDKRISGEPFILIVMDASVDNSSSIKQILLTINTNRIFTRSRINGTWEQNWQELYHTGNTSTIDMEVEFETGDKQTYTLLKK